MRVAVIGVGYVGLVTGACLAEFGHNVVCADIDTAKIAALARNDVEIYEPGLPELVVVNAAAGRLRFTNSVTGAVSAANVVFIAVGTPSRPTDGGADLTFVLDVAREIAAALRPGAVVVVKSTVPVGTSRGIYHVIRGIRRCADIAVVANPEFLREGSAVQDFLNPDRIIIGAEAEEERTLLGALFWRPVDQSAPILYTSLESAELIKYASNAFLAVKVSFINEIADLSERLGADVRDVATGIGLDPRIGSQYLKAGPGFGGSCLPKDTQALVQMAMEVGSPARFAALAVDYNRERKLRMSECIIAACEGEISGKVIAVLGLAFKANTADMRDAPSLDIIRPLQAAGAVIRVFDPQSMAAARELLQDVTWCDSAYEAVAGAHGVAIVTDWDEFTQLDFARLRLVMRGRAFIDLRNAFHPAVIREAGFVYTGLGLGRETEQPLAGSSERKR